VTLNSIYTPENRININDANILDIREVHNLHSKQYTVDFGEFLSKFDNITISCIGSLIKRTAFLSYIIMLQTQNKVRNTLLKKQCFLD
jgi:hypothetical protein